MEKQINLYECPKCRQLRLENTYIKKDVYYSTCKHCRGNKGIEENYINKNSYMLAVLSGSTYLSNNTSSITTGTDDDEEFKLFRKKAMLVNALISKLITKYSFYIVTLDTNHKFMNLLTKLTNIKSTGLSFEELKELLGTEFKYSVAKNTLDDSKIIVETHTAASQKLLGVGMQISDFKVFNLKYVVGPNKKHIREHFAKNKKEILKTILSKQESICYLCGNHLDLEDITVDHVKPIACGGTNAIENLKIACKECNVKKGSKSLEEFKSPTKEVENPFSLKIEELTLKNKTIKKNSDFATEQIAYYTQIQNSLVSELNKNKSKIKAIGEYEQLTKRIKEIEELVL